MHLFKAIVVLLLPTVPALAEIEFTGYFVAGGQTSLALSDTETKAIAWLRIGDRFGDYTVVDYVGKEEIVTLSGPRGLIAIHLKADGKVKERRFAVTGSFRVGDGPSMKVSAATLILGEENVMPLDENTRLQITPEVMSDGNVRYRNRVERRGPDGNFKLISEPTVIAQPNQKFSITGPQFEYSFDPAKM